MSFLSNERLSSSSSKHSGEAIGQRLVITCLGRSLKPIKYFLDTFCELANKQEKGYTAIHSTKNFHAPWGCTSLTVTRPMETVHFDQSVKSDLVADIQNYLDPKNREFYAKCGIPYRRGYLLHGPPGNWKYVSYSPHFNCTCWIFWS